MLSSFKWISFLFRDVNFFSCFLTRTYSLSCCVYYSSFSEKFTGSDSFLVLLRFCTFFKVCRFELKLLFISSLYFILFIISSPICLTLNALWHLLPIVWISFCSSWILYSRSRPAFSAISVFLFSSVSSSSKFSIMKSCLFLSFVMYSSSCIIFCYFKVMILPCNLLIWNSILAICLSLIVFFSILAFSIWFMSSCFYSNWAACKHSFFFNLDTSSTLSHCWAILPTSRGFIFGWLY